MKINKIKNNQTFNGFYADKINPYIYSKYIKPCIPKLEKLSQKNDIFIKSRWNPQIQTVMLECAVKPICATPNKNILRWSCLGTGYTKISSESIIQKITKEIQKI